tara:strand:+ start:3184 stop:3435 length:252 start_codon:yes stop_codon:yes gene_type:complete
MTPNYFDKDLVLTTRFAFFNVNDVVVLDSDVDGNVLKRIKSIKNNIFEVESDNKSYHSRINNKLFRKNQILGKVILKLNFLFF